MKKFASLILAMVMMCSLCIGASATELNAAGTPEQNVTIIVNESTAAADTYKITITWESDLIFTYNYGQQEWSTSTHTNSASGSWDETTKEITIANHSNVKIDYSGAYIPDGEEQMNELLAVSVTGSSTLLVPTTAEPTTGTIQVTINNAAPNNADYEEVIGKVRVTIAKTDP